MKKFTNLYAWAMEFKLHMGIYFLALLTMKCLVELLNGSVSVNIITMFEMLIIAMIIAIIESFLLPENMEYEKSSLTTRTIIWAIEMNIGILGGSAVWGWFKDIPLWGCAVLIIFLELALFLMWYGIQIVKRADSRMLNEGLKNYQK